MAVKNFWQDKWLHDQYNQRNPGQANQRESQPRPNTVPAPNPNRPKNAPTKGGKRK